MALQHSPRIVTDGLVLALDAGNTKSYPGIGTAWTDLVGSGIGTLTNGPTFDSGNGGSIVFDGTDDIINCGSSNDFAFGTGDFTIEVWCNPDTLVAFDNKGIISISPDGGFAPTTWQIRYNNQNVRWNYSSSSDITSSSSVSAGEWTQIVATRSGTALTLYINAVSEATGTSSADLSDNGILKIGQNRGGADYFDGKIPIVRLYKGKALTQQEIQQNYNAHRGRYGI
jgi:hypothetical protein